MYYGVGGIGKTTLLKHLYDNHTKEIKGLVAEIRVLPKKLLEHFFFFSSFSFHILY